MSKSDVQGAEALLTALRPESPAPGGSSKLAALIEKAKARPRQTFPVTVVADDVPFTIEFTEISGREWNDLVAVCPPRAGAPADLEFGFNPYALLERYPAGSVQINADEPSQEVWGELSGYLDAAAREDIAAALWAVHVLEKRQKLAALDAKQNREADHG